MNARWWIYYNSAALMLAAGSATAQPMPNLDFVCGRTAAILQQGGPQINAAFSPQLAQLVWWQTGNTGFYPILRSMGMVRSTTQGNVVPLQFGVSFACRSFHDQGYVDWRLVFSTVTGRMEYASFQPYSTSLSDQGHETGPGPALRPEDERPVEDPVPETEACRKFPELCS